MSFVGTPSKKVKLNDFSMSTTLEELDLKSLNKFSRQNAALGDKFFFHGIITYDSFIRYYRCGNHRQINQDESFDCWSPWCGNGDCKKFGSTRCWGNDGLDVWKTKLSLNA